MVNPPEFNSRIRSEDVYDIANEIQCRQKADPNESLFKSVNFALFSAGDKFRKVKCIHGEWSGFKGDVEIELADGILACPNGHPLHEGPGFDLGWIA